MESGDAAIRASMEHGSKELRDAMDLRDRELRASMQHMDEQHRTDQRAIRHEMSFYFRLVIGIQMTTIFAVIGIMAKMAHFY